MCCLTQYSQEYVMNKLQQTQSTLQAVTEASIQNSFIHFRYKLLVLWILVYVQHTQEMLSDYIFDHID